MEEVIVRREVNLKALRRGLKVLEWSEVMESHPQLVQPLFVSGPETKNITAKQIRDAICSTRPTNNSDQAIAYDLFMELLTSLEGTYVQYNN